MHFLNCLIENYEIRISHKFYGSEKNPINNPGSPWIYAPDKLQQKIQSVFSMYLFNHITKDKINF